MKKEGPLCAVFTCLQPRDVSMTQSQHMPVLRLRFNSHCVDSQVISQLSIPMLCHTCCMCRLCFLEWKGTKELQPPSRFWHDMCGAMLFKLLHQHHHPHHRLVNLFWFSRGLQSRRWPWSRHEDHGHLMGWAYERERELSGQGSQVNTICEENPVAETCVHFVILLSSHFFISSLDNQSAGRSCKHMADTRNPSPCQTHKWSLTHIRSFNTALFWWISWLLDFCILYHESNSWLVVQHK